jgi:pyridoxal phosphate enzyme (YggS family)
MRVFVTGVSGFVGLHLARTLLARGHEVGGSFLDETMELPAVELFQLDLAREGAVVDAALRAAFTAFRPQRVVHLAGLAHVGKSWDAMPAYFRINLLGTEAVLAAAGDVPVLLASSAEIYGVVPEGEQPIDEGRLPAPVSPYALTKAAAERLVLARGGTVVRPFNMIGSGQATHFALPTFARQLAAIAARRQPPVLAVGQRVFGENRVQEAMAKWPALMADYPASELHLIGPLQSNKAKEAVALFDAIHSVDRPSLCEALAREIARQSRAPLLFVEINTGGEPQKSGVLPQEADGFLKHCRDAYGLTIAGLMCLPPLGEAAAPHFGLTAKIAGRNGLRLLSMGMSADFALAITFGATHVRVGTAIFGERA